MAEERRWTHISIRFKPQLVEELRRLSREENRSINGTVVEAVERYLRARTAGASRSRTPGGRR